MESNEQRLAALEDRMERISRTLAQLSEMDGRVINLTSSMVGAESGKVALLTAITSVLVARADEGVRRDAAAAAHVAFEAYMHSENPPGPEFALSFRALCEQLFPDAPLPEP